MVDKRANPGGSSHKRAIARAAQAKEEPAKKMLAEEKPEIKKIEIIRPPEQNVEKDTLNKGDSFALLGLLAGVGLVIIAPPVWAKAILLALVCLGCFLFAHKSHWTHRWSVIKKYVSASVVVTLLLLVGVPQFITQWKSENRKPIVIDKRPEAVPHPELKPPGLPDETFEGETNFVGNGVGIQNSGGDKLAFKGKTNFKHNRTGIINRSTPSATSTRDHPGGLLITDNAKGNTVIGGYFEGGIDVKGNARDNKLIDTKSYPDGMEEGLLPELKARLRTHAGSPQQMQQDFNWFRGKLQEKWSLEKSHGLQSMEESFNALEKQIMLIAGDKVRALSAINGIDIKPQPQ